MATTPENRLGLYLRDRRTRLDPASFGFGAGRRRTPGLRREEVAQRANISPTWYTWLEQGRGGAPSADVLNRLAVGLMLTEPEREHLFMLALGRPPEVRYRPVDAVTPRLQRVLDAFEVSPAVIKTATWDVLAWNRAAAVILTDYAALPREERNILRLFFGRPHAVEEAGWMGIARYLVSAFRADVARAGANDEVTRLVEDLTRTSRRFAALWRENEVAASGDGRKRLLHPSAGPIELEFSSFAVEGRPELSMLVHNPVSPGDAARVRSLLHQGQAA